jgi:hypothetical protein
MSQLPEVRDLHSQEASGDPAMATGVTDRLWKIGDIVGVLEAFENRTTADSSSRASESQDMAMER